MPIPDILTTITILWDFIEKTMTNIELALNIYIKFEEIPVPVAKIFATPIVMMTMCTVVILAIFFAGGVFVESNTECCTPMMMTCMACILSIIIAGGAFVLEHNIECCTQKWITFDIQNLDKQLSARLFGQHLVKNTVVKSIKGHLKNHNPSKPLVISLHGWAGGKTYVSQIIAENLYREGTKSKFYHFFSTVANFPHEGQRSNYQDELRSWIRGNISECQNSTFVFDEVDKLPASFFNAIKPFLDYHAVVDGVDFRRAIFIFISNAGGEEIRKIALKFLQSGKRREELKLKDVYHAMTIDETKASESHLRNELIDSHLIDHFIPFLPMERSHVRYCINIEFHRRGMLATEEQIDGVADQLQYYPEDTKVYSTSGCKIIEKLVDIEVP